MSEDLNKRLEECQKKAQDYLAGWQRARADFLNYKKEEMERIGEFIKFANLELILKIIPILDNFQAAEKKLESRESEDIKGLLQIKIQLQNFLKNQGVEEIKALGEKFDPNFHEAVGGLEVQGGEADTILEEIQKGYILQGQVIRPARVKVAK